MAETSDEMMVVPKEQPKEKRIGLWGAIVLIIVAIAQNIKSAGPVEMSNMFRILFRAFIAVLLLAGGGAFLWKAAFIQKALINENTNFIVGFVTASVIGVAVSYYFGGQDRANKVPPKDEEGGQK